MMHFHVFLPFAKRHFIKIKITAKWLVHHVEPNPTAQHLQVAEAKGTVVQAAAMHLTFMTGSKTWIYLMTLKNSIS